MPATYRSAAPPHLDVLDVGPGELLGAEEVLALGIRVAAVDELLAVEEHQVDAPGGLQVVQMVGDLHEQGHARGAVVGAQEGELEPGRVRLLVGMGPGVVVGGDDHALGPLGMPRADQVDHVHPLAGERVLGSRRAARGPSPPSP